MEKNIIRGQSHINGVSVMAKKEGHLHDVIWGRSAMVRMGLESCGVRTPTSREQVILHRDRRIHVPTLKS